MAQIKQRSKLVDPFGQPIDYGVLTDDDYAGPQLIGVRQTWHQTVSGDLTPERMTAILESSKDTIDPREFLYLCEEMEEKHEHYFCVLGQRKLAVESIDAEIAAASDDANDQRIADAVRQLFDLECVSSSRFDLLDGLGKGFSASRIVWDTSASQWQPKQIVHMDPSWFLFDRVDRSTLRLRDLQDPALGLPLAPYKFIVHKPRIKSGLPIRNALARIVAFSWVVSLYMQKDWAAFAEVFGMPIRIGRYPSAATPKDVAVLRRAVANIGSDAACVLPESMKIELTQTGNVSGAADVFERALQYLDGRISKAVIGQTMTSDAHASGLNSSNANVHNEVRGDIRDADSTALARTYQRDLVKPFVDLNFGPQKIYPKVSILKPVQQNLMLLSKSLSELVPLGMRVDAADIRAKFGLADPKPGKAVDVLGPPPAIEAGKVALNYRSGDSGRKTAQIGAVVDAQVNRTGSQADPALRAMYDKFRGLLDNMIENDGTLEEFGDSVMTFYPELDASKFADVMQMGLTAAELAGRYDILEEAGGGGNG